MPGNAYLDKYKGTPSSSSRASDYIESKRKRKKNTGASITVTDTSVTAIPKPIRRKLVKRVRKPTVKVEVSSDSDSDLSLEREEETIVRDRKTLGRVDVAARDQKKLDKERDRAAREPMEWGSGLAQARQAKEKHIETLMAGNAPLSRFQDDSVMNQQLKARERWGDPMAQVRRKKKPAPVTEESARPVYKGPMFPNRYNIRPGYRWDGIDRSNGWEHTRTLLLTERQG